MTADSSAHLPEPGHPPPYSPLLLGRVKDVRILDKNILSPKPCKSGEQDTSKLPNDLSS